MQLRYQCSLTSKAYVNQQAWRNATLERCPLHPKGGCRFTRHGTYPRVFPPGARIARWYCRRALCTFSLLPDCLAARLCGDLAEVEGVVGAVEQAESLEAACTLLRPTIELPGVLRWVRRRVRAIHEALNILIGLMPESFAGCEPRLDAFAMRLGVDELLPVLRQIGAPHLTFLPAPLGFRPRGGRGGEPDRALQHSVGPAPPAFVP